MSIFTPVIVTAVRFTRQFEPVPKRIELDGISYDLEPTYTKVTVSGDDGSVAIFDVSDGKQHFRLRNSALNWQLLSISSENA